jgi:hypothetical protein
LLILGECILMTDKHWKRWHYYHIYRRYKAVTIYFFNNTIIVQVRYKRICPYWISRVSFSAFVLRWRPWCYAHRPSPEYSCGKKTPSYPIRAASFISIVLYLTHVHSVTLVGQGDYRVITLRWYFSDGQLYIVGIYDSSVNVFNVYQSSIYTLPISTTNSLQFNKSKMLHN